MIRFHKVFGYLCVAAGMILASVLAISNHTHTAAAIKPANLSEEVLVPAGEFIRGCTSDVNNGKCDGDAKPLNAIYVDAFYIDKTEVTNAQYEECVTAGACSAPISSNSETRKSYYGNPEYANYPVLRVDWKRAAAYCQWAGKRLPTEAEWEKAARGTDKRLYPWGNTEPTCAMINFARIDAEGNFIPCVGDTVAVGSYPQNASPYGALDMVGNVREWVNDLYEKEYYGDTPYYNPQGPSWTIKGEHLVRGGSWGDHKLVGCNTWVRIDEADIYMTEMIGFRCARSTSDGPGPTPAPTPQPGKNTIGPEGGLVWQAYQNHLTVAHVPAGALSSNTIYTITYDANPGNQDTLQGIDHFFSVSTNQSTNAPIRLLLGHPSSQYMIDNTLDLYRLQEGSWITDDITIVEKSDEHVIATITKPGIYGLLGVTNRLFLPLTIRQ